jgi:hypothetical protein
MGNVTLNGSVSGSITIAPPSVAGTNTATLPAGTGTVIETVTNMAANPVTGTPSSSNYLRGDGTWAAVSASGQLIRAPQILTSGTSYTTPSNCTSIYVEAVGGGAAGCGTTNTGVGAGGGAGAYCAKYFTVTGSTAYTYAIGSGGAAGTASTGPSGGNTTFTVGATTITAGGGVGGGRTVSGTAPDFRIGGVGGTATNGDLNVPGGCGQQATWGSAGVGAAMDFSGSGGSSVFGGAGAGISGSGGAGSAGSFGGGGGGGNSSTATSNNGGAGGNGVIRIWEFT